eukprot:s439_g19.t1
MCNADSRRALPLHQTAQIWPLPSVAAATAAPPGPLLCRRSAGALGCQAMKLKRFLLRYYPPGIVLEYQRRNGDLETKCIDLLNLTPETDVEVLINQIVFEEPLISENKKDTLRGMIFKLMEKIDNKDSQRFYLFKILRAHILPLTNCAFNKSGSKFITGSYDRTCRVWDTLSGEELLTLDGHKNVVYAIAFNNPFGDKIVTGSFDKTARLWDANTGQCIHTLKGHHTEIVCVAFNIQGTHVATGSMDNTAKLWDVDTGQQIASLEGHSAEIVSLNFNTDGDKILTGSFDNTAKVWDVRSGRCLHTLAGHRGEISSTQAESHRSSVLGAALLIGQFLAPVPEELAYLSRFRPIPWWLAPADERFIFRWGFLCDIYESDKVCDDWWSRGTRAMAEIKTFELLRINMRLIREAQHAALWEQGVLCTVKAVKSTACTRKPGP